MHSLDRRLAELHRRRVRTPDWVKHAVFYQIFPDRFARSDRTVHPPGTRFAPWGTAPEVDAFQGGDLRGIVDKLDYLSELGVNALYLNPIFASASTHRYHTFDYLRVDPLLGGNEALRELLDAAHSREMHVVLDGVFNHASRGFWAFHHILETGGNSPYLGWFHVHGWPLKPYPHEKGETPNYSCWWDLPALPKFNTKNPAVRQYLFDVARHWIDFGIDGWRLDVPAEIDDDDFWRTFRQVVKAGNPEAYICGEIWHEARRWLQGDQFDGVMNYVITGPLVSFCAGKTFRNDNVHPHLHFAPIDAPQFAALLDRMYGYYDWEVNFAQMNMLDSHDMARLAWIVQDPTAQRLCVLLQMTLPGAPCVYYGDEVGLAGANDPHCREAFPWHHPESWDGSLLQFYREAIGLRRDHEALRIGSLRNLHAVGGSYVMARTAERQSIVVAVNADEVAVSAEVKLPPELQGMYRQIWPRMGAAQLDGSLGVLALELPSRTGTAWELTR